MTSHPNDPSVRTSENNPIDVSWVPTPFPGRLGLTLAPGKHQASKSGPRHARNLDLDLDRLREKYGIQVLVCLLEDHELTRLQIPNLLRAAEARGMATHRLPIPDGGVLPSREPVHALVLEITEALSAGRVVLVHCAGGLGRTGTVVGCFLRHHGSSPADALKALVSARGKHCPETEAQRRFIASYPPAPPPVAPRAALDRAAAPTREARFLGAVLGGAIGDAMGHPTEFMDMDRIRSEFGPAGVTGFELFWDRGRKRFAPYTDDTQMAEAVLRTLVEAPGLDLDGTMTQMAARFVDWHRNPQGGHRAPGNACKAGCVELARGVHWSQAGGATAGGCGSVMRAYPFGLVFADDLERAEAWAVEHSKLTHRDPIALAACAAMAVGVARMLRGESVAEVTAAMVAAAGRYSEKTADMMTQALAEAERGVGPEVTLDRLRGWAAHEAIAAAVYVFARHPDDPRAAILEGANTPGDSDSIASIAGTLVGARCGVGALPEAWVRDVERSEALSALAVEALGRRTQACSDAPASTIKV